MMQALFEETASCLRSIPGLIFQPTWTSLVMILFIAFWAVTFLGIATAQKNIIFNNEDTRFQLNLPARPVIRYEDGHIEFSPTATQYSIPSVKHKRYDFIPYFTTIHLLMLFWTTQFILGCEQMTVASSVATWYFTRDRSTLDSPICESIWRVMSYHLGTVAFGSFLLFFKLLFIIPTFIRYQLRKYKDKFACINCILGFFQCFFYWLGKLLDYITESAYTITAIEGTPYCFSARVAFKTLASNPIRVATLESLGGFVILLGKLIVTVTVAIVSVFVFRKDINLHFLAVPVIFNSILAFIIANSILTVYSMAISVMFLCYAEDVQKNSRTAEGLYAPGNLLKLAQEDIEEMKPRGLVISQEVNQRDSNPQQKEAQVGFVYPNLVESSH